MGFSRAAEDRPTPSEIYNYRIYGLTFLCCLGSWMFGYNNGVIGGVLVLPSFHSEFKLPDVGTSAYNNITGNIVSMIQIGGLIGSMATFPLMKGAGRKISLVVASVIYAVGAFLQTFSNGSLGMMYAGRLVLGLGTGGVTVVVPLYIAELSPPSIRGSLVGLYEINNQLSSLAAFWCNYIVKLKIPDTSSMQWRTPILIQIPLSILLLLASIFLIPESPRFLLKSSRPDKARSVLAYVRNLSPTHPYIEGELAEMSQAMVMQELYKTESRAKHAGGGKKSSEVWGLARELWWKGNRERVIIGVCLMFGQNLTGTVALNFYLPAIFQSIGMRGTNTILLASGFFSVVKCVVTLTSLAIFIDRAGRRLLLIIASVGSALALWYIGAYVTAAHVDLTSTVDGLSKAGWCAIVMIYVYAAFYSVAWNGVVWVYCAEIFPTRIKELAVCLTTAAQWTSQFGVARVSPSMLSNTKGGFFFFYAACITLMGTAVYFFVPETKGKTLENMDEIFGTPYESKAGVEGGLGVEGDGDNGRGVVMILEPHEEEEMEIREREMGVVALTISRREKGRTEIEEKSLEV